MPKLCYVPKEFNAEHRSIIGKANTVIAEYQAAGYTLTLRQLYYQFVSRDWIANRQTEYKRLGDIIGDARLAGEIDWNALEDRGRNLLRVNTWDGPQSIVDACAQQFKLDLWADQKHHVEVWIEKEALIGVIEPTCRALRIGAFPCKGYVSLSEMWDAAYNRLAPHCRAGKNVVVLHMGDHDPSGIDMTRDIRERLRLLSEGCRIIVSRIALNMDQIEQYDPPPNPAKSTDARFAKYQEEHGDESWELDALPPDVLNALIDNEVKELRDDDLFLAATRREMDCREQLAKISTRWDAVTKFLNGGRGGAK
jgi:hypothetical protein